jgi:anti-anti-sigma regulatory factor
MARISFTVVRLGNGALVWADRPLTGSIATKLAQALDQLDADGARPVVLDLVRVPALDESVVRVFAEAALRAGRHGRGMELRLAGGRRATVSSAAQLRQVIGQAYPKAA